MTSSIHFIVEGVPKAQPRPRAFVNRATGRASVYDAGTAEHWKSQIAEAAREHLPDKPLDCPVAIDIKFAMPRPKRLMRKKDPGGAMPHTSKPDMDNLAKAVMDALTQLGMWLDDSQVYEQRASKRYAFKGGRVGASVLIQPDDTKPSGR
jgi:Holliday junction resolvase RusA-like endonuclease